MMGSLRPENEASAPVPISSSSPSQNRIHRWRQRFSHFFSATLHPPGSPNPIPRLTLRQASLDDDHEVSVPGEPVSLSASEDDLVSLHRFQTQNPPGPSPAPPSPDPSGSSRTPSSMDLRSSAFRLRKLRPKQHSASTATTSSTDTVWKSLDGFVWKSLEGQEIHLRGTHIQHLSESERLVMQRIALAKLNKILPGCPVSKPKETLPVQKRRLKYRMKAHTVNLMPEKKQSPAASPVGGQQVFGISLSECIENDIRHCNEQQRCKSLDLNEHHDHKGCPSPRLQKYSCGSSKSSLSDQASIDSNSLHPSSIPSAAAVSPAKEEKKFFSSENLLIPGSRCPHGSPRNSLSPKVTPEHRRSSGTLSSQGSKDSCEPRNPQIPRIIESCTDFILRYGLQAEGIFRKGGSAKRCKELRMSLDTGQEVSFDSHDVDPQPHDIARLMKEYLRDLPEPLLTKELYPAFLASAKVREADRVEVLRLLVGLLPPANSDTLLVLLKFLQEVDRHSYDTINDDGIVVSGNKMNSYNLATIFAPTIMRRDSSPQLNLIESDLSISVLQEMINNSDEIFNVPPLLQDEILRGVQEIDPGGLDHMLKRLGSSSDREKDNGAEDLETTVYYSSQDEVYPNEITREEDGTTVIRTKQTSTHKICFKVQRSTDRVVAAGNGREAILPERETMEDKLGSLDLFIDDEDDQEPERLINPNPARTQSALTRLLRPTI